jgi:hypothetical protein
VQCRAADPQPRLEANPCVSFLPYCRLFCIPCSHTDLPGPAWLPALTGAAIGGVFATVNRYCSARLWRPPASPLNIVVTGSTRGLGKALAREFLAHGDSVVVTGRTPEAVGQSMREIKQELAGFGLSAGSGSVSRRAPKQLQQQQQQAAASGDGSSSSSAGPQIHGIMCDVTQPESVAALAAEAQVGCLSVRVGQGSALLSFLTFLLAYVSRYLPCIPSSLNVQSPPRQKNPMLTHCYNTPPTHPVLAHRSSWGPWTCGSATRATQVASSPSWQQTQVPSRLL